MLLPVDNFTKPSLHERWTFELKGYDIGSSPLSIVVFSVLNTLFALSKTSGHKDRGAE
jgi:hypothetical protein